MSIQFAVLGFLSWHPYTGYDLKKAFAASEIFHWSGNSNQIYSALVKLHEGGWVSKEVQVQESGPSRKVYTITEAGQTALRKWVMSAPELPQLKHPFLAQLAWADLLTADELAALLDQYEEEVQVKLLMLRELMRRDPETPDRSVRERQIWQSIRQNRLDCYKQELNWVRQLRQELAALDPA